MRTPDSDILGIRPLSACIVQMAKDLYDVPELVFQQEPMKEFLTEACKAILGYHSASLFLTLDP